MFPIINEFFSDTSNIILVLSVSIVLLYYVKWHWNRRRLYKVASKLNGPLYLPFIGNALIVPKIVDDFYCQASEFFMKYGSPFRVWMGPELWIGTNDPKDIEIILNSPTCLQRNPFLRIVEILGNGLVTSPTPIWKAHRKLIQPTMAQKILDTFVETFAKQSDILADNLKQDVGKKCDIFDRIYKYSMDSICETSMGLEMDNQAKGNVYGIALQRYWDLAFERMYKIWLHPDFIFKRTQNYQIMKQIKEFIREFSDNIINIKREERRLRKLGRTGSEGAIIIDSGLRQKTFMELLLELSDNGSVFTDEDIRDETATMIAGGSDTTAIADAFVLTCLALYPEVQGKVYAEVMEQLGPDRLVEKQDLSEFKYLEQVIKETLRLFPVFPLFMRECESDVKLTNNKVLPAGSMALISPYSIQRDERYWEEPNKFDPDRFLTDDKVKIYPYAYLAFGGGPRNCIGQKYGMMSMKTTISILVRKYLFYTDYKSIEDIKLKLEGLFTKPKPLQRCVIY